VIDIVVEAWRRQPTPIACAAYRGRPGHPLIFARALFPLLEALRGDKAAWKIVDAHPDWIHPVPIDRSALSPARNHLQANYRSITFHFEIQA
jgi:molybdenum cofactor cytidylyltransferase